MSTLDSIGIMYNSDEKYFIIYICQTGINAYKYTHEGLKFEVYPSNFQKFKLKYSRAITTPKRAKLTHTVGHNAGFPHRTTEGAEVPMVIVGTIM
jgi:hypothetical protein